MIFSKTLESWYLSNKRDLPWRNSSDPYRIWLSEIILQQTRVTQGLSYYEKFVVAFPTVFDLANAKEEQVLKLWQGLGYYSRARNLHFSAKYIVEELNGVFPKNYSSLLRLKGVGDYTASAIASICFNEKTAVVDGNVYRVLSRYFGISTPINSTKGVKEFKSLAQELLITDNPGQYNQALMEFGALQCVPQNPNCLICPLEQSCDAFAKGIIDTLPVKEKKLKVKKRYFNFIVFQLPKGQTVIEKRIGKGIWENLFQFPLVETNKTVGLETLVETPEFISLLKGNDFKIKLFNEKEWIHKLSHQHLHT
ncbi:MAG: A/G-specific adenine glycosylase, partial [Flavicella sp.]